jgi:phage terminase small subunit
MALNEKQEKFCQNYILHRNATEAAKAAGYSAESAKNQGYRLLQNPEIKARIEELESELTTNVDVISEVERQYSVAKEGKHTNSALKALELLSRVRGAKPEKDSMVSVETIEEEIVEYMKIIGEVKVIKLVDQAFNIRQKNVEYEAKEDDEDDD